ncbi:hypothetical protein Cantr_07341 [Candida viswanathii]|uniref:Uncharacterized protein n=1 Tax=Candida viswanathii TaxID=5486 RepID=A0A367Y182_9ASCO|nr:hypothetical protein Cantr_07341 [Candida viswanathii]
MSTLCGSFPGLLQIYHDALFDLVATYDLYLSYKIRQIVTLLNLEFNLSESTKQKLEKGWMVLQNSIMLKEQQLWNHRKLLNETMSMMVNQGYITKKQLFEFNHNIVYELQMVQLKFDDLIESGSEDLVVIDGSTGDAQEIYIELLSLDANPELFSRIWILHGRLINKYYIVKRKLKKSWLPYAD